MYDALIFDVDGTLWDAARVSAYGWNLALAEMELAPRVTVNEIRSVSGNPFARCVEILLPELHPASAMLLETLERQERLAFDAIRGELYEGVADGIPRLAQPYPVFVVSNCPAWYLDRFISVSGFAHCLTGHDCHGLSGVGKREMLEGMRRRHAIARGIYVGDTQGDHDAALAAGLDFAFVRYGFGTVEDDCRRFGGFGELVDHFLAVRAA